MIQGETSYGTAALQIPPLEMQRFIPGRSERIPTPVNEVGLIDEKKLVVAVQSTVDPEFHWSPSDTPDSHHLYWEHRRYPNLPDESVNPRIFCNLPTSQIRVPRIFHNWLHIVTEMPPIPGEEAMAYQIAVCSIIKSLVAAARETKKTERRPYVSEKKANRIIEYHFEQFQEYYEKAREIPEEFRPFDFHLYSPSSIEDMHAISAKLGEIACAKSINHVRYIRTAQHNATLRC